MRDQRVDADLFVARIAAKRHGVVCTDHLRRAGLDKRAVSRRVALGHLHPKYRGVYAVGHAALSREGEWLAAVDACGLGAVLSHFAAACLWGLMRWQIGRLIDVTVPTPGGRSHRDGIRIHRSSTLTWRSFTRRQEIPVTTVQRTLDDLSRTCSPAEVRIATRQAEIQGWRLALPPGHVPNRSELEHLFLALCRRHRLLQPRTRVRIEPYETDFLFEDARLIVETDGWGPHRGRIAFEDDHERHLALQLRGYEVVRFTYRQLTGDPRSVAAALRAILQRRSPHSGHP